MKKLLLSLILLSSTGLSLAIGSVTCSPVGKDCSINFPPSYAQFQGKCDENGACQFRTLANS